MADLHESEKIQAPERWWLKHSALIISGTITIGAIVKVMAVARGSTTTALAILRETSTTTVILGLAVLLAPSVVLALHMNATPLALAAETTQRRTFVLIVWAVSGVFVYLALPLFTISKLIAMSLTLVIALLWLPLWLALLTRKRKLVKIQREHDLVSREHEALAVEIEDTRLMIREDMAATDALVAELPTANPALDEDIRKANRKLQEIELRYRQIEERQAAKAEEVKTTGEELNAARALLDKPLRTAVTQTFVPNPHVWRNIIRSVGVVSIGIFVGASIDDGVWLPAEQIEVDGQVVVAYVLADNGSELVLLNERTREVTRPELDTVGRRQLCVLNDEPNPLLYESVTHPQCFPDATKDETHTP